MRVASGPVMQHRANPDIRQISEMKRHAAREFGTRESECHQHARHHQHQVVNRENAHGPAKQETLEFRTEAAAACFNPCALRGQNADDQKAAQREENPYAEMADLADIAKQAVLK